MPTLRRLSDNMGDSGARVEAIKWKKNGKADKIVAHKPVVGCSLLVGSVTARSFQTQDYWLTTEITEIVSENKERIVFKTKSGSVYEFTH